MAHAAKISNGIVTQVINLDQGQSAPNGWVQSDILVGKGWSYDGSTFAPPVTAPQPVPVPDLTFAQLLIGLVAEGWITEQEGDAWLAGTLPAAVAGLISTLPQSQQFVAKARASRPSSVVRSDSLVVALGAAQGKTSGELDTFFRTYAQV